MSISSQNDIQAPSSNNSQMVNNLVVDNLNKLAMNKKSKTNSINQIAGLE